MSLESSEQTPDRSGAGSPATPRATGDPGTIRPSGQRWRLLDDPRSMRALAHPLRLELQQIVGRSGRITTADAGRELGISHGLASHHLHQLAKYGFVEQVGGADNRERPWRLVSTSISHEGLDTKPGGAAAVAVYEQVAAERALEGFLDWQDRRARSTTWPRAPVDRFPWSSACSSCRASRPGPAADVGAIRTALGQRGLRLLIAAALVSLSGDWVLRVGLAYYIYALTGSTLASALMLLASFVPQVALSSLAGVLVDRWDSRRTMVIANLLLAGGLLPLLAVRQAAEVWIVYAVTAVQSCVQQFFVPAQQSLLPAVTDDASLVTANALNGQASDVSRLAGSAAGGVLAAAGGIAALACTDIASFLLAAVLIGRY